MTRKFSPTPRGKYAIKYYCNNETVRFIGKHI